MGIFISLGISLLFLTLILFISFKDFLKKNNLLLLLVILSLLFAPLFRYQPPEIAFYLFPLITLAFMFLIQKTGFKKLMLSTGLVYVFFANLLIGGIINLPFNFQIDHTIFANQHISDAIALHQQDALYLPFRLRPLLYNGLVYIYFLLTHTFEFLSFSSLINIFLIANLYPLIMGLLKVVTIKASFREYFILASIVITLSVLGFSRSIAQEASFLFVIAPVFIYLLLLGLREINIKLYLVLLAFSLVIQINTLL